MIPTHAQQVTRVLDSLGRIKPGSLPLCAFPVLLCIYFSYSFREEFKLFIDLSCQLPGKVPPRSPDGSKNLLHLTVPIPPNLCVISSYSGIVLSIFAFRVSLLFPLKAMHLPFPKAPFLVSFQV